MSASFQKTAKAGQADANPCVYVIKLGSRTIVAGVNENTAKFEHGVEFWRDDVAYPKILRGMNRISVALGCFDVLNEGSDFDTSQFNDMLKSISNQFKAILDKISFVAEAFGRIGTDSDRANIFNGLKTIDTGVIAPFSAFLVDKADEAKADIVSCSGTHVHTIVNEIGADAKLGVGAIMRKLQSSGHMFVPEALLRTS